MSLASKIEKAWYEGAWWLYLLLPLSLLFLLLTSLRKFILLKTQSKNEPGALVVVVGNITVGGSGKTPLLLFLAQELIERGYSVGIVSRGYGGEANYPLLVNDDTLVGECGDEPFLLFKRLGIPVVVDPNRQRGVNFLNHYKGQPVNIILSDDGLQHYKMSRDVEIVVVDGQRGLGNRLCLPAGPLRELSWRLKQSDFLVCNGIKSGKVPMDFDWSKMNLKPTKCVNLKTNEEVAVANFFDESKIHAVAGIGNPQRFFNTINEYADKLDDGLVEHSFEDHYVYQAYDLDFKDQSKILMTEKDAVKCRSFATDRMWYLEVSAELDQTFIDSVVNRIASLLVARKIST